MGELKQCPVNYSPLTPLSFLERAATVYGERTSLIYQGTRYTWSETFQRCRRLASALISLNIANNDVVSVVAPNIPAMYELHFGVPMAGAVLNAVNIRLDARMMSSIFIHSEAKAVFVDYEFLPLVNESLRLLSAETCKIPVLVVIQDNSKESVANSSSHQELEYENLLEGGDPHFEIHWPSDELEAITLNYTSGTTSGPKGVIYAHRGAYLSALAGILLWEMKKGPVYLWTLPMFHCNGWSFTWITAAQGGTNICLRHVTAKAAYDAIADYKVTHLCGAPVVLNILGSANANDLKTLQSKVYILTGGAPPPPSVLARMEELGFIVTHSYGLTETYGPALYCSWKSHWDSLPLFERAHLKARQGVPHAVLVHADVKDPKTMVSVPHDGESIGEVMLRGSTVMKGYLKDVEATQKAFKGGWFHTGDLGVIHPDGYIQLKDRSKDIIISGGENISSIEVESVLYNHPQVVEAAVVARPDDYWGETPCAFVRLKKLLGESDSVSGENIISYCRKYLPHYMVPRSVVFGELPKTATGKVQKYILRERAKALGSLHRNTVSRL